MPRIRSIKPQFWGHPEPPSFPARLLYAAMWNWADDYGVGEANAKALAGFAFPYDDITHRDVENMFAEIVQSYDCVFYTVDRRPYYKILSWKNHQHPKNPGQANNPGPELAEKLLYQRVSPTPVDPTPVSTPDSPPSYVVGSREEGVGSREEGGGSRGLAGAGQLRSPMSISALCGNSERPLPPPPLDLAPPGIPAEVKQLLRERLPRGTAHKTKFGLELQAATLLGNGADYADVSEAVDEWLRTPDVYPGHLPHIHTEIVKRRSMPRKLNPVDEKAMGWQMSKTEERLGIE